MPVDAQPTPGPVEELLTAMRRVFALGAEITSRNTRDGVLDLAQSSIPSVGGLCVVGIYLALDASMPGGGHIAWSGPASMTAELDVLAGDDGPVRGRPDAWTWASSLSTGPDHLGYVVVTADSEPGSVDRFRLNVLTQQTAIALRAAQQTAQMLDAEEAHALVDTRLQAAVADLSRRVRAHDLMTAAAVAGDIAELARTTYLLTQLPVAIVDQFGHLQASAEDAATPDVWVTVRMPTARKLEASARAGQSMRVAHLGRVAKAGVEPVECRCEADGGVVVTGSFV